jgi:anti-sigma-K factor RskA
MTCPMMMHLGVYALGAADDRERALVASHLETCADCRAELAGLEPLPGLLARVPESRWAASPRTATPRRRSSWARPWQAAAGIAAAAAAAGVAGGFWLAQPSAAIPAVTAAAANPATHVRATVALTGTSWGTSIKLVADGLPLNVPCRLIVHSRSGGTEVTGVWDAWSLQVATPTRTLVTITTGRSSAPASNPGSGS